MDVSKEIGILKQDKNEINTILHDIKEQQSKLKKKLHLFNVINLASHLEDLLKADFFNKAEITRIRIWHEVDVNVDFNLSFKFFNNEDKPLTSLKSEYAEQIEDLENCIYNLNGFQTEYVSENFSYNAGKIFNFAKGVEAEFLDYFLSSELKTILKHGEMQNELNNNATSATKKMKV